MDRTRHIARQVFYTGKTDLIPDEEEELELKHKYNLEVPRSDFKFNDEVDEYLDEYEEDGEYLSDSGGKEASKKLQEALFPPYARAAVGRIIDELEDDYNLDINNLDPKKYRRLDQNLETIKKAAYRKIMFSQIPDPTKQRLARNIEKSNSVAKLFITLLLYTSR
jgi:hypothetical protein